MIKSLRESKAKLSELVERASRGEDVLITVRGKVKARLTGAVPQTGRTDMQRWADELKLLHTSTSTQGHGRGHKLSSEAILNEDRIDRF